MLKLGIHSRGLKVFSLGMLLFYGLASGRSLLPQLCGTLSSVGGETQASVSAFSLCCAGDEGAASGKPCALCTLLGTLCESLGNGELESPYLQVAGGVFGDTSRGGPRMEWSPASLRGPPIDA